MSSLQSIGIMPKLTKEQEDTVRKWAEEGANLNGIQDRLKNELGITLTYFDVRLLSIELGLKLQEKNKEPDPVDTPKQEKPTDEPMAADDDAQTADGCVRLNVDQVTMPGAAVSGRVTFSDGQSAIWYLDQFGRLGLKGAEPGYNPPAADIPVFQQQLQAALQQAGF